MFFAFFLCIFGLMKKNFLLFVLLCAGAIFADETVEGVRREIKTVEAEAAREKSLHAAEQKRHEEFIESGRSKVVSLNTQKKALQAEIDSMRAEVSRLAQAREKEAGVIRWYESRKAKYAADLAKEIDALAPYLESDFPYRASESAESIRETASELRKGFISPDNATGRVMEVFLERIRMGYTTEIWDGFLKDPRDGRELSGKYFRYGAVAALFESADGADIYWLDHSNGLYSWVPLGENLTLRAQVKDALKVAEGKAPPHIVVIPVTGKGAHK